ncbi:hypothetical protein BGX23_006045, partial [Mortierella sp. AD031]
LIRHRHQVYSFSFDIALSSVPFSNLRSVYFSSGYAQDLTHWKQFLRGCGGSLQELELQWFRDLSDAEFWNTLMALPRFKTLVVNSGRIGRVEQTKAFWKVCSKLESLKIQKTVFTYPRGEEYPFPDLSNLRELFLVRPDIPF